MILGAILLIVVAYKPTGLLGFVVTPRERIGSFGSASRGVLRRDGAKAIRDA